MDPLWDRALNFDIEIWHWDNGDVSYAATSWWYARPGATDNRTPPTPDMLVIPELPAPKDRVGRNLFGDN